MLWNVRVFDSDGRTDNHFSDAGVISLAEDEQFDDEIIIDRLVAIGVLEEDTTADHVACDGDDEIVFVRNAKTDFPICKLTSADAEDE